METTTPLIDGESKSLIMCRAYLGTTVELEIDQAYGTEYKGIVYKQNYGFVAGTIAPDGLPLDGYFLGPQKPMEKAVGKCIAIVHRFEDDDDKLIVVPSNEDWSDEQIKAAVNFREQLFRHEILRA